MTAPTGYAAVHRYDGAVIERGQRGRIIHCAVQPRDLAIVRDVSRYHFLTTDQLLELWWPGASAQAGRRRLVKLFRAGYLDRFRPISRRGSYPWTYYLGADGHRILMQSGAIPRADRFKARAIYDYGHVLHDLQLNSWALAWRRLLGETLIEWHGETEIHPPTGLRRDPKDPFLRVGFDSDDHADDLRDERPRFLRPDAIIEVEDPEGGTPLTYFIEFDRTRRVDKNYDKFRRYDCFLNHWWRYTEFGGLDDAPWVIFICQNRDHALQFLNAADHELTGNVSRPWSQETTTSGAVGSPSASSTACTSAARTSGRCPSVRNANGTTATGSATRSVSGCRASVPAPTTRRHDASASSRNLPGRPVTDPPTVHEQHDPDGRLVVLDADGWRHIVDEHPEMAPHAARIMATIAQPDHREHDPRPARERFWRERLGPSRWLFVVVDFAETPARVVTAFGRRDDPPGWWTT